MVKHSVERTIIRTARDEDIDAIADLIVRTKKLNNEFDPLFGVVKDVQEKAKGYVRASLKASEVLLLVATRGNRIVAAIRAELRDRMFYEPTKVGHITDFYVMPEFRRKTLGEEITARASTELRKRGAEMITCEVPTRNEIAVSFYQKRGFRSVLQTFAKQD
jgi:ribosomal protein S18 acetylase RimI-like enzyme